MIKHFTAVNAKIGKMYANLLMNSDYIELAHKDKVSEVIKYLKENNDIGKVLDIYDTTYEAERKMKVYKREQILKLSHYFSSYYKDFVNSILSEFEIEDIKNILRVLQRNASRDNLSDKLISYKKNSIFKIDDDSTIPEFVDGLKGTKYYRVLQAYEDESNDVILFYMEMNLDKLFYSDLVNISKKFRKSDEKAVRDLLGIKIDLLNIVWIYRGIKYYKLLPEELINFCILGGSKLDYEKLRELCYVEDSNTFIEKILNTEYKFLFDADKTDTYMDRRANRYIYYSAKKIFRTSSFDIGKFLAFMFLLDFEIKDISAIMETTRFDMTFEETLNYLVRSYKQK